MVYRYSDQEYSLGIVPIGSIECMTKLGYKEAFKLVLVDLLIGPISLNPVHSLARSC